MTRRTSSVDRAPRPAHALLAGFPFSRPDGACDDASDPDVDEGQALRAAVREALATALTDKQREVVEMHFFEGLSQGEIARKLGISQQVVQKRLHGTARRGRMIGGALPRLARALALLAGGAPP